MPLKSHCNVYISSIIRVAVLHIIVETPLVGSAKHFIQNDDSYVENLYVENQVLAQYYT